MVSLADLPAEAPCPRRSDLVAFSRGDLPAQELEAIAAHLSCCPRCLSALGTVSKDESTALRGLRRALQEPASGSFADDPEYRRMAQAVIALHGGGAPLRCASSTPPPRTWHRPSCWASTRSWGRSGREERGRCTGRGTPG